MDVNCDLGEGIGDASHDPAIMPHITSANVACGGHAGDRATMDATVAAAVAAGVVVGAHPGYPDRENFGRVSVPMRPADITREVRSQVSLLAEVCAANRTTIRYVKPHGALYHDAIADPVIAGSLLEGVAAIDPKMPILTLAGSEIARFAKARGMPVFLEAFPERGYRPDGSLVMRTEEGAVIDDPTVAAERALRLAQSGTVEAVDGTEVAVDADSLCIHGDAPSAEAVAAAIAQALAGAGIVPQPFIR